MSTGAPVVLAPGGGAEGTDPLGHRNVRKAFALVPRGTEHSFSIVGDLPARYLCIFSPPATDAEKQRLAEYVKTARAQGLI